MHGNVRLSSSGAPTPGLASLLRLTQRNAPWDASWKGGVSRDAREGRASVIGLQKFTGPAVIFSNCEHLFNSRHPTFQRSTRSAKVLYRSAKGRANNGRTPVVFQMEVKMLVPALSLFGLPEGPSAVLDLTADFAPLFFGLVFALGLCILGLAVATAIHDTWWETRQGKKTTDRRAPVPDVSDAA